MPVSNSILSSLYGIEGIHLASHPLFITSQKTLSLTLFLPNADVLATSMVCEPSFTKCRVIAPSPVKVSTELIEVSPLALSLSIFPRPFESITVGIVVNARSVTQIVHPFCTE